MTTTLARAGAAVAAAGLLIGMLSACTPETKPTPKPTTSAAFATDEEAFAAAEETYRAYVKAGNLPDGNEDKYLAGMALENHLEGERRLEDAGLHVEGETALSSFEVKPESVARDRTSLTAAVCLDLRRLRTISADGANVTPADRPDAIAMTVEMQLSAGKFLIFDELDADNAACAS